MGWYQMNMYTGTRLASGVPFVERTAMSDGLLLGLPSYGCAALAARRIRLAFAHTPLPMASSMVSSDIVLRSIEQPPGRITSIVSCFWGRTTVCVSCGGSVRREVQPSGEALMSPHSGMAWHFVCRQCGSTYDTQLLGVALARPETRAFWRTHQRIRSLPIQSLEIDGREALLVCFEPLAGGRQLELVLAKETSALLAINGGVQS